MKRFLYLLLFLVIVAGGLAAFWFLAPEQARTAWESTVEFINSPKVKGFRWPSMTEGQITVTYDSNDIPLDYAEAIAHIAQITDATLADKLGRSFVREVDIYVFIEDGQSYFWNDGSKEIRLVFADTNDMLPPGMGGSRNHVGRIVNQLCQLVGQVEASGSEGVADQEATRSLASYMEMKLIIPALWAADKDLLWPAPYDYKSNNGPETWTKYAAKPPEGMVADRFWGDWDVFWFRVDRAGGAEAVGQILDQAAGPVGNADVEGLARAVVNVTGKEDLATFVRGIGKGEN